MISKSDVASHVTDIVGQIQQRAEELPDQVRDARETLTGWGLRARRFARKNPGTVLIGAFAIGFILAKAARHA